MENERMDYLHDKARSLPMRPGVYRMHDRKGEIIYVGKAKLLRNRVSSYFTNPEKHEGKTAKMVSKVYDFDFVVVDSEFEALTLECSMIKQYVPKYNILLKDSRGFHYIRVTDGPYPRIFAVHDQSEPGTYLGPYVSSYAVRNVVEVANEAFLLPTCGRSFPRDCGKGRPCLNYHIKMCMGVCRGKVSAEAYQEIFDEALAFLRGGPLENIELMRQKMEQAAEELDFERAARYRDRIRSAEKIAEKQKVVNSRIFEEDLLAFVVSGETLSVALVKFRGGKLVDKQDFRLDAGQTPEQARADFLLQYYSENPDIPPYIALDGAVEDQELVERYIGDQRGHRVHLFQPQRGEQMNLIRMAVTNAAEQLATEQKRSGREVAALDELGKLLGLSAPPSRIESYDISHFAGDNMVGGMVVFVDGRPERSSYRRFAIRTLDAPDDYAALREVLARRLERWKQENASDYTGEKTAFGILPDLILLDGGQGQVSAVEPLLAEYGVQTPLFGMVKDSRHRTRAIAVGDGGEIAISSVRAAFTLVTKIQDEVHRFAITYQKARAKTGMIASVLEKAEGVGPATARKLMATFGTIQKIRAASAEELRAAGCTQKAADSLYKLLHEEE